MKGLILATVIAMAPLAMAHELDKESGIPTQQIALSKDLPQTTIVRYDRNHPDRIQVAHLNVRLKPGQKVANLKFEEVALNSEVAGITITSANELDVTSSTSSWGYGWRGGYGGFGYNRGVYARYGGWGGGWGARSNWGWGGNNYWGGSYYGGWAYPVYNYASFAYAYMPYWGYSDSGCGCDVAYTGWMY